ncbi:MAG: radical SAM protein [Coriobacteriia bacterium]|nr:radical SAM protein [Coriobacteriia bacterium]
MERFGLAVGELPAEYRSLYEHCELCPRKCGADRTRGEVGVCGAADALKLGRAALHWWEEPCLVGDQGSGAVFFSWCPMHCVYCQNHDLAWGDGIEVSDTQLEQVFLRLQNEEHAANINLVTPTHYVPHIAWTLRKMKAKGTLKVPVVYNCSGYESVEALRLLDGLVDIHLVDFKYANPATAKKLSKCVDYPQVALAAIKEMVRQVKVWREDPQTGLLKKGVIVRHLVLPSHVQDSADAVCMLNDALGESLRPHGPFLPVVRLSVMNQFVATDAAGDLARYDLVGAVSPEEYDAVLDIADALGIEDYFWQEGGANAESFIPKFDGTGVV